MAIVQSGAGFKIHAMGAIRDALFIGDNTVVFLRLFTNDATLTFATVSEDLDDATFDGYAPQYITAEEWSVETINGDGNGQIDHPSVTFEFEGGDPQTIRGWYVVDEDGNFVFGEKLWPEGLNLTTAGQQVTLTPRFVYGDFCPSCPE